MRELGHIINFYTVGFHETPEGLGVERSPEQGGPWPFAPPVFPLKQRHLLLCHRFRVQAHLGKGIH